MFLCGFGVCGVSELMMDADGVGMADDGPIPVLPRGDFIPS